MKCSKCPNEAFVRVDDHTVQCADCWARSWALVTERLKADFNSVSPGVLCGSLPSGESGAAVTQALVPGESNASVLNPPDVATGAPIPQPGYSEPPVAPNSFDDGIPKNLRRRA